MIRKLRETWIRKGQKFREISYFFRMETSDWIAIGALTISILALAGTGYSLYLQKQAHDREKRKEEREHQAESSRLIVKLSKHSTFDKNPLRIGKPSQILLNCFLLNDGGKIIFIRNLRLEGTSDSDNWHTFDKKNYLNGIEESVIKPGPQNHILLKPKFTAEQISNLGEFRFRVKVITTSNETYFSEVIDLKPISFATR